jgi:fused signal recognition particle receptor
LFTKFRKAVGKLGEALKTQITTREIREKDVENILEDFFISLVESDVSYSVAEKIVENIKKEIVGTRADKRVKTVDIVRKAVKNALEKLLIEANRDIIKEAREKCSRDRKPYVIVFMGVNGVGKTTTIAKIAKMFQKNGITPVIVAADTFRAGAQEQLEIHARRIGVPIIKAKYNSDPASVAFDAVSFAKKRNYCAVLVDTAGRMHTDADLVEELRKIIKVVKPDLRLLVIDSLTGNDAVQQALDYNEKIGVDGFVLTKVDADVKGGTAVSVESETGKPIFFVGTGQEYDDLEVFRKEWFVKKLLGEN